MAKIIGVTSGSVINVGGHLVGGHTVKVKSVVKPNVIVITIDDGADITISDQERVEIVPGVFVFAGVNSNGAGCRLGFEAARSILINRLEEHV